MSAISGANPYIPPNDTEYQLDRLIWRSKLSDVDCRSMAYDYRVAKSAYDKGEGAPEPDDCLTDAYEEYKKRFGGTPHSEFLQKAKIFKNRRKSRTQGREGFEPISPLYDERGQLH